VTPEKLAAIKALAEAATPGPWRASINEPPAGGHYPVTAENGDDIADCLISNPLARQNAALIAYARDDVPALVNEVERARRLLLWLSSAYLDALTSLRDEGCEPTQWGTHRNMERLATTIAESAPKGTPFTPEQMQALEAWAAEVTL
jgi:hypothetical protein